MRNFIENNNNKNQSGHQGQHSTLTSLFKFRDDIKKAMNKNKMAIVSKQIEKNLYGPLFMYEFHLSQGYRVTTRRQIIF